MRSSLALASWHSCTASCTGFIALQQPCPPRSHFPSDSFPSPPIFPVQDRQKSFGSVPGSGSGSEGAALAPLAWLATGPTPQLPARLGRPRSGCWGTAGAAACALPGPGTAGAVACALPGRGLQLVPCPVGDCSLCPARPGHRRGCSLCPARPGAACAAERE